MRKAHLSMRLPLTSASGGFRPRFSRPRLVVGVSLEGFLSYDIVYTSLRPSVNVAPTVLVAHTVTLRRHVDQVSLGSGLLERVVYRVMRLLVGDHDDTICVTFALRHSIASRTEVRAAVRLRLLDCLREREPTASRNQKCSSRERVNNHVLTNLTKQHCECNSRIYALEIALARDRSVHRAGDVHEQHGLTRQLRVAIETLEH